MGSETLLRSGEAKNRVEEVRVEINPMTVELPLDQMACRRVERQNGQFERRVQAVGEVDALRIGRSSDKDAKGLLAYLPDCAVTVGQEAESDAFNLGDQLLGTLVFGIKEEGRLHAMPGDHAAEPVFEVLAELGKLLRGQRLSHASDPFFPVGEGAGLALLGSAGGVLQIR
jgi:hypothetical protein